jgi:hypothetical protein
MVYIILHYYNCLEDVLILFFFFLTYQKKIRLTPLCLVWCIWGERNVMNFKDRDILVVELKKIIFDFFYT